jgi:hypothetical protein
MLAGYAQRTMAHSLPTLLGRRQRTNLRRVKMLCTRILTLATLVGIAASAATPAHAQVIGFKLGPTFSSLEVDDDDSDEHRITSFGGGGFIRFSFGTFGIQPEIMAVTKGADIDGPGDDDLQLQLDYVEVPVLARFAFGTGNVTPYLLAGPSFNFEYGCEVELDLAGTETSSDCDDEDVFERTKTDIGVTGALGLELRLGPGSMLVEGRYAHGLTDIAEDDGVIDVNVKNRSFAIFAGFSIPLGGR